MLEMLRPILKNLFHRPATRMYPAVQRETFAAVRGQITGIDADLCIYCGICERKCPALAIRVDKAAKSWTLDPYKCIICNVCVEVCPKACINSTTAYRSPSAEKERIVAIKPSAPLTDAPTTSRCDQADISGA